MAFCWHRWTVKAKEILPSLLEQWRDSGANELKGHGSLSHKACIVHYTCLKCGSEKVRRI